MFAGSLDGWLIRAFRKKNLESRIGCSIIFASPSSDPLGEKSKAESNSHDFTWFQRLPRRVACEVIHPGKVAEWSNAPDSKSGIRLYRIVGSNPTLSARIQQKALQVQATCGAFVFPVRIWRRCMGKWKRAVGAECANRPMPSIACRRLRQSRAGQIIHPVHGTTELPLIAGTCPVGIASGVAAHATLDFRFSVMRALKPSAAAL